MNLHQKITKRGEEKSVYSNSEMTSATDNYVKDENEEIDGIQNEQYQGYYPNQEDNSFNEQRLADVMNDSNDNQQSRHQQKQDYQYQQSAQSSSGNQYKKANVDQQQQQQGSTYYSNQGSMQQQNNQIQTQHKSSKMNGYSHDNQHTDSSDDYDLNNQEEDNYDNEEEEEEYGNFVGDVHYSEIEREIYGISKEQEQNERQERQRVQREQEEARMKHAKMLEESKNKTKKKDSRDYNSSPECIQSVGTYFPISCKVQNDCRIPLAFSLAPFHEPECLDIITFKTRKNEVYTTPYMNEEDIPRCLACQTIINPFCEILESMCQWKCNMCFNMQPVPKVYKEQIYNIRGVRKELQYGSYDILLPNKYRVKRDAEIVYWFMIDVSYQAVKNGFLRNTCEGIRNAITSKSFQSHKENIKIGLVGYDNELHLFNISSRLKSPQIFVSRELEEQIEVMNEDTIHHLLEQTSSTVEKEDNKGFFTKLIENIQLKKPAQKEIPEPKEQQMDYEYPFPDDYINDFSESEKHILTLLDQIEIMYEQKYQYAENDKQAQQLLDQQQSIFFRALEFSLDHIKFTGGKLFIFHSSSNIQLPPNKNYRLFSIQNKMEDTFISPSFFYQKGTLSREIIQFIYKIIKETNGEIYDISPQDIANKKYLSDLTESISQKQCWEAVLRLRCSNGWSVSNCMGNTCIRTNTYNLLNLNCDTKTHIIVEVQNELTSNKINYFCFQSCLFYTNTDQQRIMRVHNYITPLTPSHLTIFQNINSKILICYFAKLYLEQIIHKLGDSVQFETYIIQQLRNLIKIQLDYNRASLLPCFEVVILSILGLFKQKCYLQREFPVGMDSTLNEIISYQKMNPSELDSQFVPLLFDYQDIKDSQVYDDNGSYVFPKQQSLSYQSIYDKEIIIGDFGKEFIIFIIASNVKEQTLKSVFNSSDYSEIKKKTKEEFYRNTSQESEKIMILLNSLQSLKTKSFVNFRVIITEQGDPAEYEFYYKLIEDRYDSFQKGYSLSYDQFLDHLLKNPC